MRLSLRPHLRAALSLRLSSVDRSQERGLASTRPLTAKRKSIVQLHDLPQGKLGKPTSDAAPEEQDDGAPAYPTVVQQARNNMRRFGSCVVLTRVGNFYELYFEHADELGPPLGLKVAQKKTIAGPVSMAGFPFYQLDRFLKVLVQDLSKYVAISEEFANNASGKSKAGGLMFDRRVTRVVTPGTLVDEKFMDPFENNFLLSIHVKPGADSESPMTVHTNLGELASEVNVSISRHTVGLAWLDLSTGEFYTQSTTLAAVPSELARIGPREIVLHEDMDQGLRESLKETLGHHKMLVTWQSGVDNHMHVDDWLPMLEAPLQSADVERFSAEELTAGSILLSYVKGRLLGQGTRLQPPVRRQEAENVGIDKNSMKGLEVLETSKDAIPGGKGTLLHAVRRTVTQSGARLLRDRISSPSTSFSVINERLDLVEHFIEDDSVREDIVVLLKRTFDSLRIVQKFSLGRGDADDLVSLLRTVNATESIAARLTERIEKNIGPSGKPTIMSALSALVDRLFLKDPNALATRISSAIDEDGLQASHSREQAESAAFVSMAQGVLQAEGEATDFDAMARVMRAKAGIKAGNEPSVEEEETWIMRKTASPMLEYLHGGLMRLRQEKLSLASELKEKVGAPSLTLRWTPGLGYICHVRGVKDVKASMKTHAGARNVSTSKSTRSFFLTEWSSLGGQIDQMKMQIRAEEQRVFQSLREDVVRNLVKLRRNAAVLDELDVACSSAALAIEQGFIRPIINTGTSHKIIGGRHPTVKLGLEEQGRSFVTNDCLVGDEERVWFITGPNMAGKSTFLRQNALISILAQIGSFVPAEHAEIGIVDQIFSRIGAADNLFQDQSTFMVEMLETAHILRHATPRSFVIMDEVGRGTTPDDGIAVGFACLHHLQNINKCRTLFATHFHVLADMTQNWGSLGYYCTDVQESPDGSFRYVHKLRPGVNRQSHALKVARLAGMPEAAIDIASQVLQERNVLHQAASSSAESAPEPARVTVTTGA